MGWFGLKMQSPKTAAVLDPSQALWWGEPREPEEDGPSSAVLRMPVSSGFGGLPMPQHAIMRYPAGTAPAPVAQPAVMRQQPVAQPAAYGGSVVTDPFFGDGNIAASARRNVLFGLDSDYARMRERERYMRHQNARNGMRRFISEFAAPAAEMLAGRELSGVSGLGQRLRSEYEADQKARAEMVGAGINELKTMAGLIEQFDPETIKNLRANQRAQTDWYKAETGRINSGANVYRAGKYGQDVDNRATVKREELSQAAVKNAAFIKDVESKIAERAAKGQIDQGKLQIAQQLLGVAKQKLAQGAQKIAIDRDRVNFDAYNDYVRTQALNAAKEAGLDAKQLAQALEVNSKGDAKYPGMKDTLGLDDQGEEAPTSDFLGGLMDSIGKIFGQPEAQAAPVLAPVPVAAPPRSSASKLSDAELRKLLKQRGLIGK